MTKPELRILPESPTVVPSGAARARALGWLARSFPEAEAQFVFPGRVDFFDDGEGFDGARCHLCGSEVDGLWWGRALARAADHSFADLSVVLPCCDAPGTLADLDYRAGQAFASFALELRGVDAFSEELLAELASLLETPLRLQRG